MVKKPRLLYLAAGAAVIGVGMFAFLSDAEARPRGGKHLHFHHFQHRFYAERHFYVVPAVRPRIVRAVKQAPVIAAVKWAKKCGGTPEIA